jgi:hypothetical protein
LAEKGFIPLTGQLGISGTSYRLQLGLINGKWASRIMKGKDILDSYVYKEMEVEGEFPNQNYIVGWVLRTVAIPNINPHQIMKTTQALVKQAIDKKKQKKVLVPVSETKDIELEKVPETELRRPQQKGWVKEEGMQTLQEKEDEVRKAFKARMTTKSEEEKAPAIKTTRQLPSIPGGPPQKDILEKVEGKEGSVFCPYCGKDINFKFCPYCGKPLPHEH